MGGQLPRILVTGAGGSAATMVLDALIDTAELFAADIDPAAAGLDLVPCDRRVTVPQGTDPAFVPALLAEAIRRGADLVIPTVECELRRLSAARDQFASHGIGVLVESTETLDACRDEFRLMQTCAGAVRVPRTLLLTPHTMVGALGTLGTPFMVKTRRGDGARGATVVRDVRTLDSLPTDGSMLLQEFLPGAEYDIDILARSDGHVVAAVPRVGDRYESGTAIAGHTLHDEALEQFGRRVAREIGATGVLSVRCRRALDGTPALVKVRAGFQGTERLTIASGVDLPVLAVNQALGRPVPDNVDFVDVARVRHWAAAE